MRHEAVSGVSSRHLMPFEHGFSEGVGDRYMRAMLQTKQASKLHESHGRVSPLDCMAQVLTT